MFSGLNVSHREIDYEIIRTRPLFDALRMQITVVYFARYLGDFVFFVLFEKLVVCSHLVFEIFRYRRMIKGRVHFRIGFIERARNVFENADIAGISYIRIVAFGAYEKRYKRYYADGGKPFGGDSTGGNGGTNDIVKQRIEQLKKEAQESSDYATEMEKTFS